MHKFLICLAAVGLVGLLAGSAFAGGYSGSYHSYHGRSYSYHGSNHYHAGYRSGAYYGGYGYRPYAPPACHRPVIVAPVYPRPYYPRYTYYPNSTHGGIYVQGRNFEFGWGY